MQKAIEPVGEARSDYDIFTALAQRLGCEAEFTKGRDEMGWLRHLYDYLARNIRTNPASIPDFDRVLGRRLSGNSTAAPTNI